MQLRSFKLRFWDEHVWIVPAVDLAGCPFGGEGIDLRGDEARRAHTVAEPLVSALLAFEPGAIVRSLSIDLERPRLLATLAPTTPHADPRPRVVRIDSGAALDTVMRAAATVIAHLGTIAEAKLEARAKRAGEPA